MNATAVMAAATLAVEAAGVTANASWDDSDFYNYSISRYNLYTIARSKDDYTSASVKVTSTNPSGCKMTVRVYQAPSDASPVDASKIKDRTAGTPKVVGKSSVYTYLPNYVKENGGEYACLGFTTYSTTNGTSSFKASGKWSPDSI